jgi:hypothetical protein
VRYDQTEKGYAYHQVGSTQTKHRDDMGPALLKTPMSIQPNKEGEWPMLWIDWRDNIPAQEKGKTPLRFLSSEDEANSIHDIAENVPTYMEDAKRKFNIFSSLEHAQEHIYRSTIWYHTISGLLAGFAVGSTVWWFNRKKEVVRPSGEAAPLPMSAD